jgi:RimJ/RimL family protein N-acetyltransferase
LEQSSASHQEQPIINMTGTTIALGPFHRGILPDLLRWFNDFTFSIHCGDLIQPQTPEDVEAEYDRCTKGSDRFDFIIYERTSLRPIGIANLRDIDRRHLTAEFGIGIGERDCWGKGYGTETTSLVLDFGFTALGLHNIFLAPLSFNERAIRAYQRVGFKEIGRRREAYRIGNRVYDLVLMDCLATDFKPPAQRALELPE